MFDSFLSNVAAYLSVVVTVIAEIIGSETSPYVDGIFKLHITVPDR